MKNLITIRAAAMGVSLGLVLAACSSSHPKTETPVPTAPISASPSAPVASAAEQPSTANLGAASSGRGR